MREKSDKKTKGKKTENIRIEPRGRGRGGGGGVLFFQGKKEFFGKGERKKIFKAWEESEKRCGCRHDASG